MSISGAARTRRTKKFYSLKRRYTMLDLDFWKQVLDIIFTAVKIVNKLFPICSSAMEAWKKKKQRKQVILGEEESVPFPEASLSQQDPQAPSPEDPAE